MWRLIELKRSLWHLDAGDAHLIPWEQRLRELEEMEDPVDRLLAEIESRAMDTTELRDPGQLELFERGSGSSETHVVRLMDGRRLRGTWVDILRQMRDLAGFSHESLGRYMRRLAERWHEQSGLEIPFGDPESFLCSAIAAGLIRPGIGARRRMTVSQDVLTSFHSVLVEEIRSKRPEYLKGPFTVAEIYQDLVPYPTHRDRIGVEMNGDYEDALIRLLAGEGGYLTLESEHALKQLRSELQSKNPNTGVYREYAAVDVPLEPGGSQRRGRRAPGTAGGRKPRRRTPPRRPRRPRQGPGRTWRRTMSRQQPKVGRASGAARRCPRGTT